MAKLLIDGSNLARSIELEPAGIQFSWTRIENFVEAKSFARVSALLGVSISGFEIFMEESCKWDKGFNESHPFVKLTQFRNYVDPDLLDLWSESPNHDYFIASKDHFLAFRRTIPELNGVETIRWEASSTWDQNCIVKRRLEPVEGEKLTEALLLDVYKSCRQDPTLLRQFAAASQFEYSCPNNCASFTAKSGEYPPWNSQLKQFICPECRAPLSRGDLLPASSVVVIDRGPTEVARFRVITGCRYIVGRDPSPELSSNLICVKVLGATRQLSRNALEVEYNGDRGLNVINIQAGSISIENRRKQSSRLLGNSQISGLQRWERVVLPGGYSVRLSTNPYISK